MIVLESAEHVLVATFRYEGDTRPPVILATAVSGAYGWSMTYREPAKPHGCKHCATQRVNDSLSPPRMVLRQTWFPTRAQAAAAVERTAKLRIGVVE